MRGVAASSTGRASLIRATVLSRVVAEPDACICSICACFVDELGVVEQVASSGSVQMMAISLSFGGGGGIPL